MQRALETLQTGVDQLLGTRETDECAQAVHVGHAAGDPSGAIAVLPWGAVVAQPVGAAVGSRELRAEVQQIVAGRVEERLVFRRSQLIFLSLTAMSNPFLISCDRALGFHATHVPARR